MSADMQKWFFEVFEGLPRQGPGSFACTQRAFELCQGLPRQPKILDLGCGSGAQTFDLAKLCGGSILAVDSHPPLIKRLRERAQETGQSERIEAREADFSSLDLAPESFDLIWSEGALYNLGLEAALPLCRELLKRGANLAFTDAVWRSEEAPEDVRAAFADYPSMGSVPEVLALAHKLDWQLMGHFSLPPEAWWQDFYGPMEQRLSELSERHANNTVAISVFEEIAKEPKMRHRSGDHYGYEFFVLKKPETP